MQYLIIQEGHEPFFTNWFSCENHYVDGMVVYDLAIGEYTKDGINWEIIEEDNL